MPATPNRLLAEARGAVRDRLLKMGLMAEVGQERTYLSVGAGVSDFRRRWPPSPTAAEPPDPAATGVDAPPESPATVQ